MHSLLFYPHSPFFYCTPFLLGLIINHIYPTRYAKNQEALLDHVGNRRPLYSHISHTHKSQPPSSTSSTLTCNATLLHNNILLLENSPTMQPHPHRCNLHCYDPEEDFQIKTDSPLNNRIISVDATKPGTAACMFFSPTLYLLPFLLPCPATCPLACEALPNNYRFRCDYFT